MQFLKNSHSQTYDFDFRNCIKASAVKRRLGVRVESRGFSRDGHQGSLSRSKWVAVEDGK